MWPLCGKLEHGGMIPEQLEQIMHKERYEIDRERLEELYKQAQEIDMKIEELETAQWMRRRVINWAKEQRSGASK